MLRSFAIILFLMIYTATGFSGPLTECCENEVSMQIPKLEMSNCHKTGHSKGKEHKHRECPIKNCCLSYFVQTIDNNKIKRPYSSAPTTFLGHQNLIPQSFIEEILRPPIFSKS